MSYKTYRLWKALLVVIVAIAVGWAVPSGNPYLPIPVALIAMMILLLIRRGVKEVVVDERTYSIANRASRAAFQTGALLMALVGATLIALGYRGHPNLEPVGFSLVYSAAGLLLVYLMSYAFYSRKLGGKP